MPERHTPLDNEDDLDFAAEMKGVTRHHHDRANISKPRQQDASIAARRHAAIKEQDRVIDGLSTEAVELVESEEELIFAAPGVQIGRLRKLRQGHIPWDAGLDLHGYSINEARDELSNFIRDAVRSRSRCVLVVHGKAFSGDAGNDALIKSYVNDWLRQLQEVTAFCSAQPRDGGTGALYVLLKQGR
ncbi:MAG: Smr/MutS family endonuclease [Marinobacterium sp.]|nr:Smr/MutS family endonuclease [Marinobacterium sp.]